MRVWFMFSIAALLLTTACQSQPPTVVYIVISPTPPSDNTLVIGAAQPLPASPTPTRIVLTSTPAPTVTPNLMPTSTIGQIQIAEQPFEHGRMFWVQPRRQIWVLIADSDSGGTWQVYDDTFVEGEQEVDPLLVPPSDDLYQPRRGFGKLWRENREVREALGWAVTPTEFGYVSRYEYHPGGGLNSRGVFVPEPGYHVLYSLYEVAFRLHEDDLTWVMGDNAGD